MSSLRHARKVAACVVVGGLGLQVAAYRLSALTATHPTECIAWPFGRCEPIMASGYADVLHFAGASINLEAAVALLVPLVVGIAIAAFLSPPRGWDRSAKVLILGAALALAASATRLRNQPSPIPVPTRVSSVDETASGPPCSIDRDHRRLDRRGATTKCSSDSAV